MTQSPKPEAVPVRPIHTVPEPAQSRLRAFCQAQEELAVEAEDYEQAAAWRDAPTVDQPIYIYTNPLGRWFIHNN